MPIPDTLSNQVEQPSHTDFIHRYAEADPFDPCGVRKSLYVTLRLARRCDGCSVGG